MDFEQKFPAQYKGLQKRYNETGRAYHGWPHVEALLAHAERANEYLINPSRVGLAIYYHDAIYNPLSTTNEADSAALFRRDLSEQLSDSLMNDVSTIILATAGHHLPNGLDTDLSNDCAFFLDMDLSILATQKHVYDAYEAAIRQEYQMVPEEIFRAGRKKILSEFLARDRLYFTEHYRRQWEAPARSNLSRAIEAL